MWAVGCIFAELLTLKPLFQGVEVKATPNPFQVLYITLPVIYIPLLCFVFFFSHMTLKLYKTTRKCFPHISSDNF